VFIKILESRFSAANGANIRELGLKNRAIREIRGKDFQAHQKTDAHPGDYFPACFFRLSSLQ
jgi:hypothetical protein